MKVVQNKSKVIACVCIFKGVNEEGKDPENFLSKITKIKSRKGLSQILYLMIFIFGFLLIFTKTISTSVSVSATDSSDTPSGSFLFYTIHL